ncbi:MAG: arginase family protein [Candidatus Hermodarchaeota archaeon]
MKFYDVGEVFNKQTKFVIFGVPWNYLTSIEGVNSSEAPERIRKVSSNLALTTELGFEIPKLKLIDIGDIHIEPYNIEKNLKIIEEFVDNIYDQKKDVIPIMIGGDHFCTYPVFKAVSKKIQNKKQFGVLILDSHLDFYQQWDGSEYSHATVAHRVFDLTYMNKSNMLIVGTRDIDIPELEIAQKNEIRYLNAYLLHEHGLESYIEKIIDFFNKSGIEDLYISIDIDVLDPSAAPATGYPIPGGFTYRELWTVLRRIIKNFNVKAIDLVEVAPNLDSENNRTSITAAKLLIESISFLSKNMK